MSIGTIAIVDFRLLGFGMRGQTPAALSADLEPWTRMGIAVMLITGPLMFSTDAVAYHYNPSFQFGDGLPMFPLALPLMALHWRAVLHGRSIGLRRNLAAAMAFLLWTAVVFGGRMIVFVYARLRRPIDAADGLRART